MTLGDRAPERGFHCQLRHTETKKQVTWDHSALMGPFYFKTGPNPNPAPNPVLPALATPQTNASVAERSRAAFNQGRAALDRGDFDRAIADFSEAIRLEPRYPGSFNGRGIAYNNRGLAYGNKKDFDLAIGDFSEAIRLNPTDAIAFNSRGHAFAQKKDLDSAIADFNEAIRLEPKPRRSAWRASRRAAPFVAGHRKTP
jgi:tetratricopeptide (TPR) repeat protein